jgi:hypothetical protein
LDKKSVDESDNRTVEQWESSWADLKESLKVDYWGWKWEVLMDRKWVAKKDEKSVD